MHWIKRLFAPHIIALSRPYSDGKSWSYIVGDENKYELRKFQTAEDAYGSYNATLTGLRLGSPEVNIKLIKFDIEQARAVAEKAASYHQVIERQLSGTSTCETDLTT
jgi:hypothetical protein